MCGRFSLAASDAEQLARRFAFSSTQLEWRPSYNIAPTEAALAVVAGRGGERQAAALRWGLIPFWAKDAKIGATMINAKAETLAERPAFKESLESRRCLVLADGFYEWEKAGKARHPIRYTLASGEVFAFAGLWARWRGPAGMVESCTIVTTETNELIRPVHDRMPVILSEEAERLWLDLGVQELRTLESVLRPLPGGSMRATRVSEAVNSVKNKGPECVAGAVVQRLV